MVTRTGSPRKNDDSHTANDSANLYDAFRARLGDHGIALLASVLRSWDEADVEPLRRLYQEDPNVKCHASETGVPCPLTNCNSEKSNESSSVKDDFASALTQEHHPYHSLAIVLLKAYEQASAGKGKERHAQDQPFDHQPMQAISRLLQTPDGMAYQVAKKLQESQRMALEPAIRELLGAIVYTAGVVVYREGDAVRRSHGDDDNQR